MEGFSGSYKFKINKMVPSTRPSERYLVPWPWTVPLLPGLFPPVPHAPSPYQILFEFIHFLSTRIVRGPYSDLPTLSFDRCSLICGTWGCLRTTRVRYVPTQQTLRFVLQQVPLSLNTHATHFLLGGRRDPRLGLTMPMLPSSLSSSSTSEPLPPLIHGLERKTKCSVTHTQRTQSHPNSSSKKTRAKP